MPISVYLGSAGFVVSIFLLWRSVPGLVSRSDRSALESLGIHRNPGTTPSQARVSTGRIVRHLPVLRNQAALQKRIDSAGLTLKASDVQFVRFAVLVGSLLLGLLAFVATGSTTAILVAGAAAYLGAFVPVLIIGFRADARQEELEEQLPDILDRLKITLEAGMGFDSALAKVVKGRTGPGYDEFRRVLQDLQLGVSRDDALSALGERTTITDLRLILGAILQSSRYGVPLVEVLRVQTIELRDKRWQRAQERAQKVPVNILFPLIFCILPTFFIVLVGPAVLRLMRTL